MSAILYHPITTPESGQDPSDAVALVDREAVALYVAQACGGNAIDVEVRPNGQNDWVKVYNLAAQNVARLSSGLDVGWYQLPANLIGVELRLNPQDEDWAGPGLVFVVSRPVGRVRPL